LNKPGTSLEYRRVIIGKNNTSYVVLLLLLAGNQSIESECKKTSLLGSTPVRIRTSMMSEKKFLEAVLSQTIFAKIIFSLNRRAQLLRHIYIANVR
jgi:hypothetical protein